MVLNTVGERINYCRGLLNISRKKMSDMLGDVSVPTLSRWELNVVITPDKKIAKIVDFFHKHGISVSEKWIMTGEGDRPINSNARELEHYCFDELSHEVFFNLEDKIKDFYFKQMVNNFFNPIIKFGDYVAGIKRNSKNDLIGKLCFFSSQQWLYAGIFEKYTENEIFIKNIDGAKKKLNVENIKQIELGEINWIVRRN